jgi:hypothetical protein
MRPTSQYGALAMRSVTRYGHLSLARRQGCSVTAPTVEWRGGGCGWWGQLVQGHFFNMCMLKPLTLGTHARRLGHTYHFSTTIWMPLCSNTTPVA